MAEPGAPQRASEEARLEVVDVVRGFALAGLFLVHMVECYELYWVRAKPGAVADTVFLLFMGKSFSLLALCFGFSFYILMHRAAQRGVDFTARFAWRLTVLFAIGAVHAVIYRGDIIQLLAAMGFVLLLANRIKDNRKLVALALLCFLGPTLIVQTAVTAAFPHLGAERPFYWDDPAMRFYTNGDIVEVVRANLWSGQWPKWWFMIESGRLIEILGLYLTGMVLGRIGFFARPGDFAVPRWIGLAIAAALTVGLYFARDPLEQWFAGFDYGTAAERNFGNLVGTWFELAATATWALLLIAIYRSPVRALVRPLAPLGRLTLTLYIAQSAVFVPIFYHFGAGVWRTWSQETCLYVGLAALVVQMIFAHLWLKRFHYGPLEWVWRALTYWSRDIPFARAKPAPAG